MPASSKSARSLARILVSVSALAMVLVALLPTSAEALCMARPMRPAAYYQAQRAIHEGRITEAVILLSQSARNPHEARGWVASARIRGAMQAQQKGQFQEAELHYRAALVELPGSAGAKFGLASSLLGRGQYRQALELARELTASHDTNTNYVRLRAQLHMHLRDRVSTDAMLSKLRLLGDLHPADLALLRRVGGVRFTAPGALGKL